jgi:uncharacterized membrane protein YwaF
MNIDTLNAVWWGLLAVIAMVCFLLWLIFRGRSEKTRRRVILFICTLNFLLFWVYKYWLSQDVTYLQGVGREHFEIWLELPLQLCNINILLIPLALVIRRKSFFAFCFYTACLGALMAIVSPPTSFAGNLFLPHNIGFYGTHALLIICGVSLATLGFFRPRQRDALWTVLILLLVTCAIHGVNTLMRHTLHVDANYFYTYGADGSLVLSDLYTILPIPLVYLFLLTIFVVPVVMALTALINLPAWLRKRKGTRHKR